MTAPAPPALDWLLDTLPGILGDISGRVTAEAKLADLGVDSVDLVELEITAGDRFGIDLPDGAFADALTVADLATAIDEARS
jgi:acyl carrier protein